MCNCAQNYLLELFMALYQIEGTRVLAATNLNQKHNLKFVFGVWIRESFTWLDSQPWGKVISRKVASECHFVGGY